MGTVHIASPEHEIVYQELAALLKKHADKVSEVELLAIAANMLGKIIAMQNQRTMTREKALAIVAANLELGNRQVITELLISEGGNA